MAMTGGKSYLVRSVRPDYGKKNWTIDVYVYVKEKSQSTENNTTTLSLGMYVVTPGAAYDIGPWYKSSDSYLGTSTSGAGCHTFDGAIPNFGGTRWIAENKDVTVTHNSDGTKTATIYWKWGVNSPWGQCVNPSGYFSHTITTIPRATTPTLSASSVSMGGSLTINMPRASSAFTHTLTYSMGSQSGTIGTGLGTSKSWTVPYSLANAIPSAVSGTCTITCNTYSGSTLIGTKSVAFTATVPSNSNTQPTVSCTVTPVNTLADKFAGVYIQGITKVKTVLSGAAKLGASIATYYSTVETSGEASSPTGATYTHPAPTVSGQVRVRYSAFDTRGIYTLGNAYINVLPYSKPSVIPVSGEREVICQRCTSDGTLSSSGTYLRIKAGRAYSKVESGGKQLNYCTLRYRYKAASADNYSSWVTILMSDTASDTVDTVRAGIVSSTTTSYDVQINALDDIGNGHTLTFTVPTDKVNFHEREGGDGAAFGKYSEKDHALEVAEDWELVVCGERWKSLAYSSSVSASANDSYGKAPSNDAVYYRVENGNHVYIAFNCAFNFDISQISVNSELIPAELRPARTTLALCPADGKAVARVMVLPTGRVMVDWVQLLASATDTTSRTVSWIDGYIDYFITP
jgi:hypothetical protein